MGIGRTTIILIASDYETYAGAPDWFDTDWKTTGQDFTDDRWRLDFDYGPAPLQVTTSGSQITLTANVNLRSGETMTVSKRIPPSTTWVSQTTAASTTYTDGPVATDQTYEYKVEFAGNGSRFANFTKASIRRPPTALEQRGTIALVVDRALVANSPSLMSTAVSQVTNDLIADGWTVARYVDPIDGKDAPRHSFTMSNYLTNVLNIRNFINTQPGIKGAIIIGHVTIPYSGLNNPDGHPEHGGALPTDMFYGSATSYAPGSSPPPGTWSDYSVSLNNTTYPDNSNQPGDGKFDQTDAPSAMRLFVGRVDFANLFSFGTVDSLGNPNLTAEANLLVSYFLKAHNFRVNALPYANVPQKGIVYTDWNWTGHVPPLPVNASDDNHLSQGIYDNARRTFAALSVNGIANLDQGDPFFQKFSRSYLWGFLAGNGQSDGIGASWPEASRPYMQHLSSDVANGLPAPLSSPGGAEAQICFYTLLGSYFGDWNLSNDFLRATIGKPTNGLASTWLGNQQVGWQFHGLGLGETLGECVMTSVNNPTQSAEIRNWMTIIGDPTLRLNMFQPPAGISAVNTISGGQPAVQVSWTSAGAGTSFRIYRAATTSGPFTYVDSASASPKIVAADSRYPVYMVRGVSNVATGCGSYDNLSLGAIATAQ
jgi:hypothetical protein